MAVRLQCLYRITLFTDTFRKSEDWKNSFWTKLSYRYCFYLKLLNRQILHFILVKYIHSDPVKKELMLCRAQETTTKGEDILEKINTFFEAEGLQW